MREAVSEKIRQKFIVKKFAKSFLARNPPNRQGSVRSSRHELPTCRSAQWSTSYLLGALNTSCCIKVVTSIDRRSIRIVLQVDLV
jgi:hypothetical protein